MKRISDEKIAGAIPDGSLAGLDFWDAVAEGHQMVAQAQLESCEKEVESLIEKHGEAINVIIDKTKKEKQEIFEEIEEYWKIVNGERCPPYFRFDYGRWQALKKRILGGVK